MRFTYGANNKSSMGFKRKYRKQNWSMKSQNLPKNLLMKIRLKKLMMNLYLKKITIQAIQEKIL